VEGGSFTAPFTRAEGKVDLFLLDMDERGGDKAVVMGLFDQISNEQLSELMREHSERIIGFAGVANPKSEDSVAVLEEAVGELGLRGLKLHPDLHSFSPADPEIVPLIRCAAELDVPVLIHCFPGGMVRGYFNLNTPGHIDTLMRRVPGATIIVGHFGWPRYLDLIAIGQIPGVYVETSWGLTSIAELKMIGIDNIVFGSDWCSVQIGMEQGRQIRLIEGLDLTGEEKDKILGGNMGRVLNL
jgi:predicted TIM-barrel fold metal-dependent hydrolase